MMDYSLRFKSKEVRRVMPTTVRNDLNGVRVRLPGTHPIYLIDLGKKRHIPNPEVYNELFADWKNVAVDANIDSITTGDPIPKTAMLFRCFDSPKVFLLDGEKPNQTKRHMVSPAVMGHYNFAWSRIHVWNVPLDVLGIPDGPPIKNPPNAIDT